MKRFLPLLLALSLTAVSIAHAEDDAAKASMTSVEFARHMGAGYNLGNTLEATGGKWPTIAAYETSWGNPLTTREMIDKLASLGFRSLRLPVAWSNLMAEDFTIHPDLLNRVEEIAGWAMDAGMTVVLNIHWDGGWHDKFYSDYGWAMAKYEAIWTQVATRFRDAPLSLVLESFNEIAWPKIFNPYGGLAGVTEKAKPAYDLLGAINQRFVDLVRATGGNNATRFLLIAGYNTDIELTSHPYFQMPSDPADHLMISVHYYHPWDFVGLEQDASYAPMRKTWGTPRDMLDLRKYLGMMQSFSDRGYGVVLGEYSVAGGIALKEAFSVRLWDVTVTRTALSMGYCPMFWDNGYILFDRANMAFYDDELMARLSDLAKGAQ